jgi:cytochrome c-type biogenesis protein CcmH/NrfF
MTEIAEFLARAWHWLTPSLERLSSVVWGAPLWFLFAGLILLVAVLSRRKGFH